jgi:hexosaminidase
MKKIVKLFTTLILAAACGKAEPAPFSVIPAPASVSLGEGSFTIKTADYYADPAIKDMEGVSAFMEKVAFVTGRQAKAIDAPAAGSFTFNLDPALADEEYTLDVTPKGVTVSANSYNGFLYASVTLAQMLPAKVQVQGSASGMKAVVPCASIQDKPRFAYRGFHLDCARHFFSTDEVKKFISQMANYKLNTFHWHLTDDQGWRFESKKYPRLNEISAYREGTMIAKDFSSNDGVRYGGYYTQEEMKDVVEYACKLGITVIPEIDLPGHMVAVLAAYPELGCTGGPYEVWTRWGIAKDVLCPGKEVTFGFLEGILDELCEVFPSEYIHIGGDECPKDRWKECPDCLKRMKALGLKDGKGHTKEQLLQNYVTKRVQDYLDTKGRKIIGWDEILEGELAPGATIMSWRGVKGGIEASKKGFDAIMTPSTYVYFDYFQSQERDKEPLAIGGNLPIDKTYNFEPFDGVPEEAQKHILGVQANLWTEYIATEEHLEYMTFPRMAALSEVQWCAPANKDYERFKAAADRHKEYYELSGITYHKGLWGEIGLPGSEQPARTPEELEKYLQENNFSW